MQALAPCIASAALCARAPAHRRRAAGAHRAHARMVCTRASAGDAPVTAPRRVALGSALAALLLSRTERPAHAADAGDWSSPGLAKGGADAQCVRQTRLLLALSPSLLTPCACVPCGRTAETGICALPTASCTRRSPAAGARACAADVIQRSHADTSRPCLRCSGEPAKAGDSVQYDYTLRRANGYFIFATVACGIGCGDGTPEVAALGSGKLIAGLDELLTGMRPGEKRRALIPPALGYVRRVTGACASAERPHADACDGPAQGWAATAAAGLRAAAAGGGARARAARLRSAPRESAQVKQQSPHVLARV
jgi:hypothetical protein